MHTPISWWPTPGVEREAAAGGAKVNIVNPIAPALARSPAQSDQGSAGSNSNPSTANDPSDGGSNSVGAHIVVDSFKPRQDSCGWQRNHSAGSDSGFSEGVAPGIAGSSLHPIEGIGALDLNPATGGSQNPSDHQIGSAGSISDLSLLDGLSNSGSGVIGPCVVVDSGAPPSSVPPDWQRSGNADLIGGQLDRMVQAMAAHLAPSTAFVGWDASISKWPPAGDHSGPNKLKRRKSRLISSMLRSDLLQKRL